VCLSTEVALIGSALVLKKKVSDLEESCVLLPLIPWVTRHYGSEKCYLNKRSRPGTPVCQIPGFRSPFYGG
jgi:hypothetical protein